MMNQGERDEKAIFKNCTPFINCISKTNNTQIDDAQDVDIVMPMCNLIAYSDIYSKTSGSLWQYYTYESTLDDNNNIIDFPNDNNNSISFKFTGQKGNGSTKDVEIIMPLKYLSDAWITLEMPLINCEISLQLKWSAECILVARTATNQVPNFRLTDTKNLVFQLQLYQLQDNVKLLKQLEPGFKRTIN